MTLSNKNLSTVFFVMSRFSSLVGLSIMVWYYFGNFTSPLQLIFQYFIGEIVYDSPLMILLKPIITFINQALYGLFFALCGIAISGFLENLSLRYQFNTRKEYQEYCKKRYKNSFINNGKILTIENVPVGFLDSAKVLIKTDKGSFQAFGRIKSVKIGSTVKKQGKELIIVDDEKEKRLLLDYEIINNQDKRDDEFATN